MRVVIWVCSLVLVAARGRRGPAGLAGFTIFGAFAVALLVVQIAHPR